MAFKKSQKESGITRVLSKIHINDQWEIITPQKGVPTQISNVIVRLNEVLEKPKTETQALYLGKEFRDKLLRIKRNDELSFLGDMLLDRLCTDLHEKITTEIETIRRNMEAVLAQSVEKKEGVETLQPDLKIEKDFIVIEEFSPLKTNKQNFQKSAYIEVYGQSLNLKIISPPSRYSSGYNNIFEFRESDLSDTGALVNVFRTILSNLFLSKKEQKKRRVYEKVFYDDLLEMWNGVNDLLETKGIAKVGKDKFDRLFEMNREGETNRLKEILESPVFRITEGLVDALDKEPWGEVSCATEQETREQTPREKAQIFYSEIVDCMERGNSLGISGNLIPLLGFLRINGVEVLDEFGEEKSSEMALQLNFLLKSEFEFNKNAEWRQVERRIIKILDKEPEAVECGSEQTPEERAFECFSKIIETMSAGRHCGFDKELTILLNLVRNNGLNTLYDFLNELKTYPMASKLGILLIENFYNERFEFKVIMGEIIRIVEEGKNNVKGNEVVSLRVAEETACSNRLPEGALDSFYDRDFVQESLDEDERRFKEMLREYKERVDNKLIEIAHWIEKELIKTSIIPQAEVPIKAKELYDLLEESEFHKETLEKSFEVDENIENEIFPIILNKLKEKLGELSEGREDISEDEILRSIYIADGAVSQDNAPLLILVQEKYNEEKKETQSLFEKLAEDSSCSVKDIENLILMVRIYGIDIFKVGTRSQMDLRNSLGQYVINNPED